MAAQMKILSNVDLSAANTLRLPCQAERFAAPTTLTALRQTLAEARREEWPVTLLGAAAMFCFLKHYPVWWCGLICNSTGSISGKGMCLLMSGRGLIGIPW
ncbi:hypothetical protein HORIV_27050 [Vreelandella olivaria]|uniref:Uncharacterized protein n=1 Tax=Vreelandella olivaria TaxID=390919 RepID=A0ABM7GHZ9_9GAMM|nr:hypothetical protein HORIV_27050 [Halomonas olivaria]